MKPMMPMAPFTIELVISFLIFLTFFGWVGLKRGALREIIVFFVATISWFLLQEQGNMVVSIANLGGKLMALIAAGGLSGDSGDDPLAAIEGAEAFVTAKYEIGFLFFIWIVIVVLTYFITNKAIDDKSSKANGWAIIWGIANGLFFASIFLPRLALLWMPGSMAPKQVATETAVQQPMNPPAISDGRGSIFNFLSRGFAMVSDAISGLWAMMDPVQPYVVLILLTVFLIVAYSTISGPKISGWGIVSTKPKKDSK